MLGEALEELVCMSIADRVATVTIDRPSARNALNPVVLAALVQRLREADEDPAVGCVVLTGGPHVFSAGADIDALEGLGPADYLQSVNRKSFEAIRATRKPLVAAVSGYCLGGGCEIALACDIVVAGDTAVFGQPEINIGIIPGAGGTQLWAERSGSGIQAVAALEAALIDAFAARRMGLVDAVVPAACVVKAAEERARSIASRAPLAVRSAKAAMIGRRSGSLENSLQHEVLLMASLLASADAKEGVRAFLDKRPCLQGVLRMTKRR